MSAPGSTGTLRAVRPYDREYFQRWYHDPRTRVHSRVDLERHAAFAVAATEFVLERRVLNVLDVCCGIGQWQPVLARLRPRAKYVGVDASPYVVERYGRARHIRLGRFGELDRLRLEGPFDLIVCSGALYYIPDDEVVPGLAAIGKLLEGLAYLEIFTSADEVEGDTAAILKRPRDWYEARIADAGLVASGLHCYVTRGDAERLGEMETAR